MQSEIGEWWGHLGVLGGHYENEVVGHGGDPGRHPGPGGVPGWWGMEATRGVAPNPGACLGGDAWGATRGERGGPGWGLCGGRWVGGVH